MYIMYVYEDVKGNVFWLARKLTYQLIRTEAHITQGLHLIKWTG